MFSLTKNPNKGGNPAKENKTPEIRKQRVLLDFFKRAKSERSLFFLFLFVLFIFNNNRIPHKQTPELV